MTEGRDTAHQVIALAQIMADEAYQPREELKESHVRLLMASDPEHWPPLLVSIRDDGGYHVIDGFHRLEAASRLGVDALPCIIDPGAGYPEGFAANLQHGLTLSLNERKEFARWLHDEEPQLSLRELGRRSGLHHETVKKALEDANESTSGDRRRSTSDPIRALVRQVDRAYQGGYGRTWLGYGTAGNSGSFRHEIETYDPEDQPDIARALLAFGHACVAAAQPYLSEEG